MLVKGLTGIGTIKSLLRLDVRVDGHGVSIMSIFCRAQGVGVYYGV